MTDRSAACFSLHWCLYWIRAIHRCISIPVALNSTGHVLAEASRRLSMQLKNTGGSRPEAGCPSAPWRAERDDDIKTGLGRWLLYPSTPDHPVCVLSGVLTVPGTATVSKTIFRLRVLKVLDSLQYSICPSLRPPSTPPGCT